MIKPGTIMSYNKEHPYYFIGLCENYNYDCFIIVNNRKFQTRITLSRLEDEKLYQLITDIFCEGCGDTLNKSSKT